MVTGVDVSKDTLVCCTREGHPWSVDNTPEGVNGLLLACAPGSTIAMEATGRYHRLVADTAYARNFTVVVLNPRDVNRYLKSVAPRAGTDPISARGIAEFASVTQHHAYATVPSIIDTLKNLVRTRYGLVKERVALENRGGEHPTIAAHLKKAVEGINTSVALLEKQIAEAAKELPQYQLLVGVPGFGSLTAAYIGALLASGTFRRSDSFVAFIGLDLRVRDSGKHTGKRRLSKRGDPEARRLLYLAAFAACRCPGPFADLREHYVARGFSKTEATVFVARKLARVAWAISKKQEHYRPERVRNQLAIHASSCGINTASLASQEPHVVPPKTAHDRTKTRATSTRKKQTLDKGT